MIKILQVRNIDSFVESRRQKTSEKDRKTVQSILNDVRKNGDSAVKKYERKFNFNWINEKLRVSAKEIKEARSKISRNESRAIYDMIETMFANEHNLLNTLIGQKKGKAYEKWKKMNSKLKLSISEINGDADAKFTTVATSTKSFVPIPSVGCYIPGGQARYPSSVVMSVMPARVAGVKRIVVVSPPNDDGKIDPLTIVAADRSGATEIYQVGGAQAIGALAYGTKSIPKVDKIVGPGGKFVSIAKSLVSDQTAIDMIAGPTELGIIVDASSDPELVALDLISQAEHSNDTMCFVITQSKTLAKQIQKSVNKSLRMLRGEIWEVADRNGNLIVEFELPPVSLGLSGPERSSISKESISKNGFIAVCKNQNEVIELANKIAPEHLELMVKNARSLSKKITGAGLVLIGKNTPSAASDYLLGTNHILPTSGFGRTRGGLSVLDFLKLQTVVESKKSGLRRRLDSLKALTDAEGLPNHYKAVKRRLD